MKGILKTKYYLLTILFSLPFLFFSVSTSEAQKVVVLTPGDNQQINFFLSDVIDLSTLKPLQGVVVISLGNAEKLSVSLSTNANSENPLFEMNYILLGLGFSPAEGPQMIFARASTPLFINTSIPINSNFGMAVLGVAVTGIKDQGDFNFPAIFTLTLNLSEGEANGDQQLNAVITAPTDGSEYEHEEVITFQGSGTASGTTIVGYTWDFGDGETGSGQTVTHAYDDEGEYTVSLTVTDNKGETATDSISLVIIEGEH